MASPAPDAYSCQSGGIISAGRYIVPAWAPSAGELKAISYAAGYFGTHGGATLEEIDPIYQTWHPLYGSGNSYSPPFATGSAAWNSINAYCGMAFNPTTRQYVGYGAGHSAINACAPYAFDLNDLKWKWLDVPLPFDSFYGHGFGWPLVESQVMAYYVNGEVSWLWGEINGGSTTWGALAQPGVIQPVTGHSRGMNICIPGDKYGNGHGVFFKFDSPTGNSGGITGAYNSHLFDFDNATWSRAANYSTIGGTGAAYDYQTNKVITFGAGGSASSAFGVFDVPTKTWATRNSTNTKSTATDSAGNLLHEASRLYLIPAARTATDTPASPGNGVKYEFLAVPFDTVAGSGTFTITTLTINVVTTWPLLASGFNDYLGWSYCPANKCLYCIAATNGSNKYWKLTPPSGAVTQSDYLSGTWTLTEHALSTGTWVRSIAYLFQYNRMHWDTRSRAFIWHSGGVNDPVMAWRPEGV